MSVWPLGAAIAAIEVILDTPTGSLFAIYCLKKFGSKYLSLECSCTLLLKPAMSSATLFIASTCWA